MHIKKLVIVNIIFFLLFLIILEFACLFFWAKKLNIPVNVKIFSVYYNSVFKPVSVSDYFNCLYEEFRTKDSCMPCKQVETRQFRPFISSKTGYYKKPILFMGCSFTYGAELQENETISAQFAKLTGRPVYNFAGIGWTISHLLYQLKREDIYGLVPEPEYLIYTYINDHKHRIAKYKPTPIHDVFQPKYKKSGNNLKIQNPTIFERLYIVSTYRYYSDSVFNYIKNETVELYFLEALKEMRKHWKSTKLVILLYDINNEDNLFNELAEEGEDIIVINVYDFVSPEILNQLYLKDGHPSAQAWKLILPKLIRYLNAE